MDLEPNQKEQSVHRKDYVRLNSISDNPFDDYYVKYHAFLLLGYPMEFRPDNTPHPITERYGTFVMVYVDPSKKEAIKELQYQVSLDGIDGILSDIDNGRAHRLAKLLKGEEEDYYALTPQSPKGNNPGGRYHGDQETLKRCYMRAYERYHEKVKLGTMIFEKREGHPYGPFTATPDSSDIKLYEKYQQDNLSPITSDELIQMTKQIAEKVLERSPELRP